MIFCVGGQPQIAYARLNTTREQTLERCPNLALASAFFAPGTKGPFSPGW